MGAWKWQMLLFMESWLRHRVTNPAPTGAQLQGRKKKSFSGKRGEDQLPQCPMVS